MDLASTGVAVTERFDTLSQAVGTTNNVLLLPGWTLNETGGGGRDNEQYAVDAGSSNTGDVYSYGSAGSGDRALGSLQSGTLIPAFGACFSNQTGAAITALDIAFTGEQWRVGAAGREDRLNFEISTDATSLTTGTWAAVAALDFLGPDTTAIGARDGNATAYRTSLAASVTPPTIAAGATFWIRWVDGNASGADDGLAVDDFSLTPHGVPELTIDDAAMLEGNSGTTTLVFTVHLSSPAPAGGVSFDIATADGSAVAADDYVAANLLAQVIPAGASSYTLSVSINGDVGIEADETFTVGVTHITGATPGDLLATGTIRNDDAMPATAVPATTDAALLLLSCLLAMPVFLGKRPPARPRGADKAAVHRPRRQRAD